MEAVKQDRAFALLDDVDDGKGHDKDDEEGQGGDSGGWGIGRL